MEIPTTEMQGNFFQRARYFWNLYKVDLYNPGSPRKWEIKLFE
jgi:hypothetical protein